MTERLNNAIKELARVDSDDFVNSPDYTPMDLTDAWNEIEIATKADPKGTWEIFRDGTDKEFSVLVNCLGEIGEEFSTDEAHREVMKLAKQRGTPEVMDQTRSGFGVQFEKYFNDPSTEPEA